MPWDHCDVDFILDDEKCPGCGITKAAWTLQIDQTRVFRLGKKKGTQLDLDVVATDEVGHLLAGWRYELALPDGRVEQGTLAADARIFRPGLDPGQVDITLWPPHRVPRLSTTRAGWPGRDQVTTPDRAIRDADPVVVDASTLDVVAVDDSGRPLAGWGFELQLPNGATERGTLGADARLVREGVAPGQASLALQPPR